MLSCWHCFEALDLNKCLESLFSAHLGKTARSVVLFCPSLEPIIALRENRRKRMCGLFFSERQLKIEQHEMLPVQNLSTVLHVNFYNVTTTQLFAK